MSSGVNERIVRKNREFIFPVEASDARSNLGQIAQELDSPTDRPGLPPIDTNVSLLVRKFHIARESAHAAGASVLTLMRASGRQRASRK